PIGLYRVLTPQGLLKNEPALLSAGDATTGCAVDIATGDLFGTGFWDMSLGRFSGSLTGNPAAHALWALDLSAIASLPSSLPIGKSPPAFVTLPNPDDPTRYLMAVESVVFNKAGDMFMGAQVLADDAVSWA